MLDKVAGTTATVNITPITSLMAARLSPNGLPQGLVTRFEQAAAAAPGAAAPGAAPLPTSAEIQVSRADILRIIEPVRLALGDTTDPVTGSFSVGGVGHDKLLDSLTVTISPTTATSANIEVTVRTKRDDETPLPAVAFASNTPAQQLPQVDNTLRRSNFGADGTSAKIEALVVEAVSSAATCWCSTVWCTSTPAPSCATRRRSWWFSRFDRVEVTAPVGLERSATRDVLVLRPMIGVSNLRMVGSFLSTRGSPVVWLGADWVEPAAASTTATTSGQTVTHPIQLDGGGAVWISDPQGRGWSDERLERLSHKSAWTFRYFLNGNTGNVPDAVQSMTTISRAPSVREARQQPLAVFAPSSVEWLRSMSMDKAANQFWMSARAQASSPVVTEPPAISLSWEVSASAVIPMNVNGFGRTTSSYSIGWEQRTVFDRLVGVASTVRETPMTCTTSNPTLRAVLCHDGVNADRYSLKTMFTDFELWGKDARQIECSHSYATFIPSTRRTAANPEITWLNAAP